MEPLRHLQAAVLPLARANVDTDQVVPARYLQKPLSSNFGDFLFRDLRHAADGSERPEFVLNQPPYRGAKIVVARANFGCGSSREHAVWALYDHGFRVAIAPSFGDIFHSNALKNGFLPIRLPAERIEVLLAQAEAGPGLQLAVDVQAQTVTAPDGTVDSFALDPFPKQCLLEGLDEIDYTLRQSAAIEAFERRQAAEA